MVTLRQHLNQQLGSMKTERANYLPHWMDIDSYIMPRTSRFFVTDKSKGNLRNSKINDNTATMALRALRSGMMSGITNPARPWIQMRTVDPDLNKWHGTRVYLDIVRDAMVEIFLKSNLYTTLPTTYSNQGGYGTDCFSMEEDDESVIRFYPWPIGSYMIAADHRLSIDTAYREFQMTAIQMVRKFGEKVVSQRVRDAYNRSDYQTWFTVLHALEPNPDYVPGGLDPRNNPYRSIYWEQGSRDEEYLRESGYNSKPFIASRGDVLG